MKAILSIRDISKSYGRIQALKHVSFDVPEGSVFGILGPNGSGKTTLLSILLDVLQRDGGQYQWFNGIAPEAARRQIGSLLETPNFYHYLSAMDNLAVTAKIRGCDPAGREAVLKTVGLYERRDSKFATYSLGMKQRLAIGAALLGRPKVLVLDEPTNGLDPAGIAEIRALIRQLSQEGITIIMASHLLDEVEKVCDHVAILKKGELLLSGKADEVLESQDQIEVAADDLSQLYRLLQQMPGMQKITEAEHMLLLTAADQVQTADINRFCAANGITISHLARRKKSLEMKFMELTN